MTAMSNIHILPEFKTDQPRAGAVPEIVEILEKALQQAKQGQLIGIGIIKVNRDPIMFSQTYHPEPDSGHSLTAGVVSLLHRLGAALNA